MNNEMRLQKFLSQSGICSRRRAEELMVGGRVKVNGKVCTELGTKIDPENDKIEVDGKSVNAVSSFIYLLINKPPSYITSLYDPEGRAVVTDLLPKTMPRVWPVGRLDWDTEGLLIMTNDGKLTNLMTHPSHEVPKTYAVKVRGQIGERDEVLNQLRQGVEIEPGEITNPAQVRVNYYNGNNTWLEMTITEGKNRQVRRMWDAVEFPVMKLRRISMGSMKIDGLPSGAYRTLTHAEVAELYGDLDEVMPELARPTRREKQREHEDLERNVKPRAQFSETTKRRIGRSIAAKQEVVAEAPKKTRESINHRSPSKFGNAKSGAEKFGSYKPAEPKVEEKKSYDKKAHFQVNPVTGEKVVRAKRGYRPVESVEGDRVSKVRRENKDAAFSEKPQRDSKPNNAKRDDSKRDYKSAKDLRPGNAAPKDHEYTPSAPKEREYNAKRDDSKRDYKSAKDLRPGQAAPKDRDYSESAPKERSFTPSASRERGFKVSAPRDRDSKASAPRDRDSKASAPRDRDFKASAPKDGPKSYDKASSGKPASSGRPSSGKPSSGKPSSGKPAPRSPGKSSGRPSSKPPKK